MGLCFSSEVLVLVFMLADDSCDSKWFLEAAFSVFLSHWHGLSGQSRRRDNSSNITHVVGDYLCIPFLFLDIPSSLESSWTGRAHSPRSAGYPSVCPAHKRTRSEVQGKDCPYRNGDEDVSSDSFFANRERGRRGARVRFTENGGEKKEKIEEWTFRQGDH